MASIEEQLAELEGRRQELENERASLAERIATAAHDLEVSQAELDVLNVSRCAIDEDLDSTRKLKSDVITALSAIQNVRARVAGELSNIRREYEVLAFRVSQELSPERVAALLTDIATIDERIAKAIDGAKEAGHQLAAAEAAAMDAQERASVAVAAQDAGLKCLQGLSQRIDAAREVVVTLRAKATDSIDAGRMDEAVAEVRDLECAIERLEEALATTDDERLAGELPDLWDAALSASAELSRAIAAVGPLQNAATVTRQSRDALVAGRERHIAAILVGPSPVLLADGYEEMVQWTPSSAALAAPPDPHGYDPYADAEGGTPEATSQAQ